MSTEATEKHCRDEAHANRAGWKKCQYPSERQWSCEDHSDNGEAWNYLPHHRGRSRACRSGEDGLAGVSEDHQTEYFRPGAVARPPASVRHDTKVPDDQHWCDLLHFFEDFDGNTAAGIGASHQTCGTSCGARVIQLKRCRTTALLRMPGA